MMRTMFRRSLVLCSAFSLFAISAQAGDSGRDRPSCTLALEIEGAITPGILDYLERGYVEAERRACRSLLLTINTPGGNLQTTRRIVEKILAAKVPTICLVSPSGGHAGSAGAIILMACHVSGAEPGTNIGAATPVALGQDLPKDVRDKVMQDTLAWVQSLQALRGRNVQIAKQVVSEAKAVDASSAVQQGLIDFMAEDVTRFLDKAHGRPVKMAGGASGTVEVGALMPFEPDVRLKLLQFLTDPEIAYLLFMAALGLLFFEITHFGAIVPGVLGSIALVIAFISFHKLDVAWGGVMLMFLGVVLLVAEGFVASFGALGLGGLFALGLGSFLLFDPVTSGFRLSWVMIITTVGTIGLLMLAVMIYVFRGRRRGPASSETALLGKIGVVMSLESPSLRRGMVQVSGENWRFLAKEDLEVGGRVRVLSQEGLTLNVERGE